MNCLTARPKPSVNTLPTCRRHASYAVRASVATFMPPSPRTT